MAGRLTSGGATGGRAGAGGAGGADRAGVAIAPSLIVASDPVACASKRLVDWLRALAAERPAASPLRLAISGGSALEVVLRAAPEAGELWRRVALTWVDERCVPLADPASNRGEAMRRGLLAPGRVVPLLDDGESPSAAIARYDRCYAEELAGGLDLVVLGLGPDGHVASLFPGRAWPASGIAGFVTDSPKPPARRLTLSRGVLAGARHVLLFATGESKREALERVLQADPTLPATGLPGLVVVTDLDVRAHPPSASRRLAPDPADVR